MKYSKALKECIDSAFLVASHYEAEYLESWHLLIAMANHNYSVAGATLNEFPYEIGGSCGRADRGKARR